jgi:putative transposase
MEVSAVLWYDRKMEYQKQAHAVYYTRYHIVVSAKYRRKIFKEGVGEYLQKIMLEISKYHPDIEMIEVNTDLDYVHFLISIPPKYSVSEVVRNIKANTGRRMREKFKFLDKVYWGAEGIWSIGYFVSTVGINESVIRKYIENQATENSGQAKLVL